MMNEHYWNMHWGAGWGIWLLFFLICLAIYLIFRNNKRNSNYTGADSPIDILKKRYAEGEITREQFDEMKKELS